MGGHQDIPVLTTGAPFAVCLPPPFKLGGGGSPPSEAALCSACEFRPGSTGDAPPPLKVLSTWQVGPPPTKERLPLAAGGPRLTTVC